MQSNTGTSAAAAVQAVLMVKAADVKKENNNFEKSGSAS